MDKKYFSIMETAAYFGISRQSVNNMINSGRLKALAVLPGRTVVSVAEIERFERENIRRVRKTPTRGWASRR